MNSEVIEWLRSDEALEMFETTIGWRDGYDKHGIDAYRGEAEDFISDLLFQIRKSENGVK